MWDVRFHLWIFCTTEYVSRVVGHTLSRHLILGMTTTRTRLNVLANVFRKPLQQIFVPFDHFGSDGPELHDDDKYVLGNNVKKVTTNQALPTEFAVLASTSNFVEAIDPLVSGKTKAEQLFAADDDGKRVCTATT